MQSLDDFRKAVHGEPGQDYIPLGPYLDRSYLSYAVSVLLSRAIPDVRDGLKPVHRRILYAMGQLGLGARAPFKKSARVVGDVIGKYHPHGDASVYEAMVLMAQNFNLRYPLIDGQGNWGSLDGDSAAAMRYTECRLTEFSKVLLEELAKGTVDFRPNYDGNELEPAFLPARVPTVLLADQLGIAVGMASNVPAHNLAEVCRASIALFQHPNTTLKGLLRHIRGPDFPCGGQIINPASEIEEIYRTGTGMLTVRARYEVKRDADGWHLVFTELPPKISPEQVLLELDALSNPQPKAKGKKAGEHNLTPEQRAAKQSMLARVGEVNNGAGNDTGPVHLEVYPRSRRQDPVELAGYLFGVTSLEARVKVQLNLINLAGLPTQMSLLEILTDWNRFRFETVTRRSRHRLEQVEARLHILEGFTRILLDLDEVIRLIRGAEDDRQAKAELMARWSLSEVQADKILDLKLRQLTRLDQLAIQRELGALGEERRELERVLGDAGAMTDLIVAELREDLRRFGDPRRTVIEEAEASRFDGGAPDEPVTIIVSKKGWARSRAGHGLDLTGLTFKDGDTLHTAVETRTAKSLVLFDENGRAYTIDAGQIPGGRGDGVPLTSLIELQGRARIVAVFVAEERAKVLLASTSGYGFVTEVSNLVGRNRAGKAVLNPAGGKALPPVVLRPGESRVAAVSSAGYMAVFDLDEVPEYPRGKGNKLLALHREETLYRVTVFFASVALPARRGTGDVVLGAGDLEPYVRKRGARGRLLPRNIAVGAGKRKAALQEDLF
ncbi:MAG: DNA topoisomerase IV subunit A [Deferrisomatales bacterium]|nr:DNA topoisomerase IV subunit A [Deferrisomatales bacterium]